MSRDWEPLHSIRISAELWAAAKQKAAHEGTTVSDVIRRYLQRWVKRP